MTTPQPTTYTALEQAVLRNLEQTLVTLLEEPDLVAVSDPQRLALAGVRAGVGHAVESLARLHTNHLPPLGETT